MQVHPQPDTGSHEFWAYRILSGFARHQVLSSLCESVSGCGQKRSAPPRLRMRSCRFGELLPVWAGVDRTTGRFTMRLQPGSRRRLNQTFKTEISLMSTIIHETTLFQSLSDAD